MPSLSGRGALLEVRAALARALSTDHSSPEEALDELVKDPLCIIEDKEWCHVYASQHKRTRLLPRMTEAGVSDETKQSD